VFFMFGMGEDRSDAAYTLCGTIGTFEGFLISSGDVLGAIDAREIEPGCSCDGGTP